MHANDFITRRERLIKAYHRSVITMDIYQNEMHNLFVEAGLSKGFTDDIHQAGVLYATFAKMQEAV